MTEKICLGKMIPSYSTGRKKHMETYRKELLENLDIDDLCGQLLCYDISGKNDPKEIEEIFRKTRPGGIFVAGLKPEQIKYYTNVANKYTKVPVIVCDDVENGTLSYETGERMLPHMMACGACDDQELVERAAEETAKMARKIGIHWALAPVVDINSNPDNPVTNIRAISDDAKQVAKIGAAVVRGMQKHGYLVCSCKHFPGDGVDDRNQHFCTSINSLSLEEWMDTYGYVYKTMIENGTASFMAAHIALPAWDGDKDEVTGYKPSVLSHKLMNGLLKGELGFQGCIVSDAMSMIGACSMTDPDRLAVEYINAGGDMVLFPEKRDFERLKQAVLDGVIERERLLDAVSRILLLKEKARLFEDQEQLLSEIQGSDFQKLADEIGEKSIKIVRNYKNILPLSLKPGAKILLVTLKKQEDHGKPVLQTLEKELNKRGFETKTLVNPSHRLIKDLMDDYDSILVNCKMSCQDYPGGSLRAGWDQFMTLWRGYILKHPKMVFTSFGDPYKLYEFPFLHTYVNAFSPSDSSQRGFVKVLLGEVEPTAKNPVSLPGFFEREV